MIAAVLSIACSHLAAPSGAVAEAVTKKDFLLVAHRGVVPHGFS